MLVRKTQSPKVAEAWFVVLNMTNLDFTVTRASEHFKSRDDCGRTVFFTGTEHTWTVSVEDHESAETQDAVLDMLRKEERVACASL